LIEQEIASLQRIYDYITKFLLEYSFQLFGAIFILILGILIARKASKLILDICHKNDVDITLATFISNVFKIMIILLVSIISLGKIGISITPFVAAIGALSLGAGLALQGVLSNYGAGFTIIISRHFKVGDTVQIKDVTGLVQEIRLSHTIIVNEDLEEIVIPNRHIVGEILHNSFQSTLVEGSVGISYQSDVPSAIQLIHNTLSHTQEKLENIPPPLVGIQQFDDSSIAIGYRFHVPTAQLFQVKYQANLNIFQALQKANIDLPYPQRDIRIIKSS